MSSAAAVQTEGRKPAERLVFEHTVQSLVEALGKPLAAEHVVALRELGVEMSEPLLPAYPWETFAALVTYVARQCWPALPPQQAYFELGRAFIERYMQTPMGAALKVLARVIGPHRTLERTRRNFRTANNYTETRLERLGPTTYTLWFNCVVHADYYRGLMTGALGASGVRGLEVKVLEESGEGALFRLSWEE